jgi:hypothetical protein
MQNSKRGVSRAQIAIAFTVGMVITAALAQTPAVAEIFSYRLHESAVPALPDTTDSLNPGRPGTGNPEKPYMSELVYAAAEGAVSLC